MRNAAHSRVVVLSVVACAAAGHARAAVRYVDAAAPPGGDGTSWATARNDLQQTLVASMPGDEIRVGPGTYRPTAVVGDRSASFTLRDGMALRGGYAGSAAANPDEQDPAVHVTTLSGDIAANDGPSFTNRGDNVYHVVKINANTPPSTAACVVDGVTIVGGYAEGSGNTGGGMQAIGPSTLNRCVFRDNYAGNAGALYIDKACQASDCLFELNKAQSSGGAVQLSFGTSIAHTFRRCTFRGNIAALGTGGAVDFYYAYPLFVNCTFEGNSSNNSGGAVKGSYYPLTCINCGFFGNTCNAVGGGLWVEMAGTLVGCVFSGNSARTAGAANGIANMYNCTIANNHSTMYTPGGVNSAWTMTVRNSILWGNSDPQNGSGQSAQLAGFGGGLTIGYSIVQGWTGSWGPPTSNGSDPLFVLPAGIDNVVGTPDDDLRLMMGSPAADSGDNNAVPADSGDVNENGNTAELLPLDIDGSPRISDDPRTSPAAAFVNRGAYENIPAGPRVLTWKSLHPHTVPVGPQQWLGAVLDPAATGNGITGPTTEPRQGGLLRIEVAFDYPVQLKTGGSVGITVQPTVNGTLMPPIPFPPNVALSMADANTLRIHFNSTISNASCCRLDIANAVIDSRGAAPIDDTDCMVRVLLGDVTRSGDVTLTDALLVAARAGSPVLDWPTVDVDRNSVIDVVDALIVKAQVKSPPRQALCP